MKNVKIVEITGFNYYVAGRITFDVDGYEYLVTLETEQCYCSKELSKIDQSVNGEIMTLCNAMGDCYYEDSEDDIDHLTLVNDVFCKEEFPYLWAALEAKIFREKNDETGTFVHNGLDYQIICYLGISDCTIAVVLGADDTGPKYDIWELWPWNETFIQTSCRTFKEALVRAKQMANDMKQEPAY